MEAYEAYLDSPAVKQPIHYSFSGFRATLYRWSIKPTKYDKYSCPLCFLLYHSGKSVADIENDWHSIEKDVIWAEYRSDIEALKDGNLTFCILIMDYSMVHELCYVSEETGEDRSKLKGLSILNFTLVLAHNEEYHYDFCATGKQGPAFWKSAMNHLANKIQAKVGKRVIKLYSDADFRTYGTVFYTHQFSTHLQSTIIHTFFPRYHGHSRCDAHFGRSKTELRKHYPTGGLDKVMQVIEVSNMLENTDTVTIPIEELPPYGNWSPSWGQQIRLPVLSVSFSCLVVQEVLSSRRPFLVVLEVIFVE